MRTPIFFSLVVLALAALIGACNSDETIVDPGTNPSSSLIGDKDTLSGNIKGIMKSGKTYYLAADATVQKGDTLTVEPGAKLLDLSNHALFVDGAMFAHGTPDQMIYFGPIASRQTSGAWAGIQCDSPSVVSMKYCTVEWAGGLRPDGRPRPAIYYFSNAANTSRFYLEDCVFNHTKDDGFTVFGGKGHVLRNKFLLSGEIEGSGPNFKNGFEGEIAYNYIWSPVDHAIRVETSSTVLFPQTNVDIHNNTIVSYGFKNASRPGAGVIMDKNARGNIYNNIFVNGRVGLLITSAADTTNIHYGNNLFYASEGRDSLTQYFYPETGVARQQSTDLIQIDPMFVHLDTDINAVVDNNDVHLQSGSPAIGAGNTQYDPDLGAFTAKR